MRDDATGCATHDARSEKAFQRRSRFNGWTEHVAVGQKQETSGLDQGLGLAPLSGRPGADTPGDVRIDPGIDPATADILKKDSTKEDP